jgi:NADP-dependent 3-hydroxy acid dehydrogenase YdfG
MTRTGDGKVVWITGAGSGIGRASAILLAARGHRLVLTGRRAAPLEETAALARAAPGVHDILCVPADLARRADADAVVSAALGRRGRLDAVVGAAGVNVTQRMWSQLSAGDMDHVLDGNLRSQMYTVAAALPAMRERRDGVFAIISSIAGRVIGAVSGPMYTAAKHGLTALSHSINVEECVNGIRACAIHPGEVDTPMLAQRPKQLSPAELATVLRPEDVAEVVRFVVETPANVCLNEIWVTPTHNRGYVAQLGRGS